MCPHIKHIIIQGKNNSTLISSKSILYVTTHRIHVIYIDLKKDKNVNSKLILKNRKN